MNIDKLEDGKRLADIEPVKGKRFRRQFKTKAEAVRFEAMVRERLAQNPDWNLQPKGKRRLSELVARWALLYGSALVDGENRRKPLVQLVADLGDPVAIAFSTHHYTEYRAQQLTSGANGQTLNNRPGYLRAVFNKLLQQGEIDYANPLLRIKPLKLQERELTYLNDKQITTLFEANQKAL